MGMATIIVDGVATVIVDGVATIIVDGMATVIIVGSSWLASSLVLVTIFKIISFKKEKKNRKKKTKVPAMAGALGSSL